MQLQEREGRPKNVRWPNRISGPGAREELVVWVGWLQFGFIQILLKIALKMITLKATHKLCFEGLAGQINCGRVTLCPNQARNVTAFLLPRKVGEERIQPRTFCLHIHFSSAISGKRVDFQSAPINARTISFCHAGRSITIRSHTLNHPV